MLAEQRQVEILREIRRTGGVRVIDLVRTHGVSDMTIRRDLDALARRGLIVKVHGGATAADPATTDEPGFAVKASLNQAEKEAIASRAAQLVQPGSAIGLSAGTTTWALATLLLDVPALTVVTNSVPVSEAFFRGGRPDQTVILTGGIRTPSDALVGADSLAAVGKLNLDQVFLGVHGMSIRAGFSTPNAMEADVDQAFVRAAPRLIVLADHTKWETVGLCTIAPLSSASVLVTDSGLSADDREALSEHVDDLVIADVAIDGAVS